MTITTMDLMKMFIHSKYNMGSLTRDYIAHLEVIEAENMRPTNPRELDDCFDHIILLGYTGDERAIIRAELSLFDTDDYRLIDAFELMLDSLSYRDLVKCMYEIVGDVRQLDNGYYYKLV